MYCLPLLAEKCPITKVNFSKDENGKISLTTSTDPVAGLPIIDLKLS